MSWRELLAHIDLVRPARPGIAARLRFDPAAPDQAIADAEARLGARFPVSLGSLLRETDGVMELLAIDGGEWFESLWLVWPVAEMVRQNQYYRTTAHRSRELDRVVWFATAGVDGILFGFPVLADGACAPQIVAWRPMAGELVELAPTLEDFFHGWLSNTIPV